jgi:hypothetical protein
MNRNRELDLAWCQIGNTQIQMANELRVLKYQYEVTNKSHRDRLEYACVDESSLLFIELLKNMYKKEDKVIGLINELINELENY